MNMMMDLLYSKISPTSPAAVIISVALMMILGFIMTRVTGKLRLPNVTAYILTGIFMGPYMLNLIPEEIISGTDFLSDIALAFIAFSVGEYFKMSTLRKNGLRVIIITVFEALIASVFVFLLTYVFLKLNLAFSVVLAALASATAPASTLMTIRQTHAKGDLVDTLLQVVALDDVVGLLAFSVAISIALSSISVSGNESLFAMIVTPLLTNTGVLILGGLFGLLLKFLMGKKYSTDNRLIIAVSLLLFFCGICSLLNISPLLGCMSMGTVYINSTDDDKLFKQLNYFSPPILLLFFVRSGLSFNLDSLFSSSVRVGNSSLLKIGVLYFIVRIVGKYAGCWLGCLITKKSESVRNYLGLALIPQAGVAIGLAAMCSRILGDQMGGNLQTIILASSVLYELVGPPCAKLALYLSHSYGGSLEEITAVETVTAEGIPRSPVEIMTERIRQIQEELKNRNSVTEEEAAFTEAAEEQDNGFVHFRNGRFINC
jgi:Kef-type K+ transport system membrane component KefB